MALFKLELTHDEIRQAYAVSIHSAGVMNPAIKFFDYGKEFSLCADRVSAFEQAIDYLEAQREAIDFVTRAMGVSYDSSAYMKEVRDAKGI